MNKLKSLLQRVIIEVTCNQGWHGDNIVVTIDDGNTYELHCTRCGLVHYATGDDIWWGFSDDPEYQKGYVQVK